LEDFLFIFQPRKASILTKRGHTCEERGEVDSHMWRESTGHMCELVTRVKEPYNSHMKDKCTNKLYSQGMCEGKHVVCVRISRVFQDNHTCVIFSKQHSIQMMSM
jgi:hypothetical protein